MPLHRLVCLLSLLGWLPALLAAAPAAPSLPPYRHVHYSNLVLSCGVSIDDTNRLVVWDGETPRVLERATDSIPWPGDADTWVKGEFVDNPFPAAYRPGTPGVNIATSKHVRIIYGNHPAMTDDYVRGNLRLFEEVLKLYHFRLGFPVPFESVHRDKRDGKKHRVDVIVGASGLPPVNGEPVYTGGGCFGCFDERGYGHLYAGWDAMRHTPPSGATPHEMAHACQMHTETHSPGSGFWWEAHANWMMLQYLSTYPTAGLINQRSAFYAGHGTHYYDCWQIFEHLMERPGFGYPFIARIWTQGPRTNYLWRKAAELAAPRSLSDEWGLMARRNVTWDYAARGHHFRAQDTSPDKPRLGRAVLEPVPWRAGWFRVPWSMAPQQFGYNLCQLEPRPGEVTALVEGFGDPTRGADWRASLVATAANGSPRYSALAAPGQPLRLKVLPDDRELHLVVIATPTPLDITAAQDYRGFEKQTFPWQVQLSGTAPLNPCAPPAKPSEPGAKHPNGGGFVAATAHADRTAFIGPQARVLGRARVTDRARLEDCALVQDEAVVSGDAVVRGSARVTDRARVMDRAHVADFACAREQSTVAGTARLLEHATLMGSGRLDGRATQKGFTFAWGPQTGGDAILDGDYANGLNARTGVWFLWLVNEPAAVEKARSLDAVIAEYRFDRAHDLYAWDTRGVTHGWLVGRPARVTSGLPPTLAPASRPASVREALADPGDTPGCLELNGRDQCVELRRDIACVADLSVSLQVRPAAAPRTAQTLLEFFRRDGPERLTLSLDATGRPVLTLVPPGGAAPVTLTGRASLPGAGWTQLGFSVGGSGAALLVNGAVAASDPKLTTAPWDLRADHGYLGRGRDGAWFAGRVDDVTFRSQPAVDRQPPRLSTPPWRMEPLALNPTTVRLAAAPAEEASGRVEYRFQDTGRAFDTGWRPDPAITVSNLRSGATLNISLTVRDALSNTAPATAPFTLRLPSSPGGTPFANGLWRSPAARASARLAAPNWEWTDPPASLPGSKGRSSLWTDDRGRAAEPAVVASGVAPRLDYRVQFPKPGKYFLRVRGWAVHDGNNRLAAGLNGELIPQDLVLPASPDQLTWSNPLELTIDRPGENVLHLWPRLDGALVETITISVTDTVPPDKSPL